MYRFRNGVEITAEELRGYENTGMSEAAIAEKIGVSRMSLYTARKVLKCPVRFRSDRGKERKSLDDRRARKAAYMREYRRKNGLVAYGKDHREKMERKLGRKLESHEVVHHIDGNVRNNNLKNLKLMNRADHSRFHAEESWRGRIRLIEYEGEEYSLQELADLAGILKETLHSRLNRGWSVDEAVKVPLGIKNIWDWRENPGDM